MKLLYEKCKQVNNPLTNIQTWTQTYIKWDEIAQIIKEMNLISFLIKKWSEWNANEKVWQLSHEVQEKHLVPIDSTFAAIVFLL
jgi:hypothetical protein